MSVIFLSVFSSAVSVFNPVNEIASTGDSPIDAIVADILGDFEEEIITSNFLGNDLSIHDLNGNLLSTISLIETNPRGLDVGHLNDDSFLDIVVAMEGTDNVTVLLNNGDGTFNQKTLFSGEGPIAVKAVNIDFDSELELVVVNQGIQGGILSSVSIFENDGLGDFSLRNSINRIATSSRDIEVVDLTGDNLPEIVVSSLGFFPSPLSSTLSVFENFNGSFGPEINFYVGSSTASDGITAADLDNDGDLDLVAANQNKNFISVLENNGLSSIGSSSFRNVATYASENQLLDPQAIDLNGDSYLDLVFVRLGTDKAMVYLNKGRKGAGTFTYAGNFRTGGDGPVSVSLVGRGNAGDDLVIAHQNSDDLTFVNYQDILVAATGSGITATGTVGPLNSVRINGNSGGIDRKVTVNAGVPITLSVAKPVTNVDPTARFVLNAAEGLPNLSTIKVLPGIIGVLAVGNEGIKIEGAAQYSQQFTIDTPGTYTLQGAIFGLQKQLQTTNAIIVEVI